MKDILYRKIYKALNEDLNMILSDDDFEEPEIDLGVHMANIQKNILSDSILKKCKEQDTQGLKELINNWNGEKPIFFASDDNIKDVVDFSVEALGDKANLNWIDTSNVTNMSELFSGEVLGAQNPFNGDISQWNVSNVTNMFSMFWKSKFNGDISGWDVSNVINMKRMFMFSVFKGDISRWDVSSVTDMSWMFYHSIFNGDIRKWDVFSVTNMHRMFAGSKFNGDIRKWDVSNVRFMEYMFAGSKFNRDISKWDVSNVTNMAFMFDECSIKEKYKPKTNQFD